MDSRVSANKNPKAQNHGDPLADDSGIGGSPHLEAGKYPQAKDQQGIESDVKSCGDDQNNHRSSGISCTPKNGS